MPNVGAVVQVLNYLGLNPDVADSLEGIVRWRLMQGHIDRTVRETKIALEWLVQTELVMEDNRVSAGALYRSNSNKKEEIEAFLARARRDESIRDEEMR
jgi:hypothetical protein